MVLAHVTERFARHWEPVAATLGPPGGTKDIFVAELMDGAGETLRRFRSITSSGALGLETLEQMRLMATLGLAGWLAGWLVGWVGWLVGWLVGLVGWFVGWLAGWLAGRFWLAGWVGLGWLGLGWVGLGWVGCLCLNRCVLSSQFFNSLCAVMLCVFSKRRCAQRHESRSNLLNNPLEA